MMINTIGNIIIGLRLCMKKDEGEGIIEYYYDDGIKKLKDLNK